MGTLQGPHSVLYHSNLVLFGYRERRVRKEQLIEAAH